MRRPGMKQLGLSCLSLAILLAVVEAVFQIRYRGASLPRDISIHDYYSCDRDGCWRIKPNAQGWHNSFDGGAPILVSINSLGIRGPELRNDTSLRVAFVGDSITFNGGVAWSNSFEVLVEALYNKSVPGNKSAWQCLNLGISDTGTEEYYQKIRCHALRLGVNHIVLGLYLNDSRPPQGFLGESSRSRIGQWVRKSGLNRLLTVRFLQAQIGAWRVRMNPDIQRRFEWTTSFHKKSYQTDRTQWEAMVAAARYDWGAAWDPANWVVIERDLHNIVDLCRTNGVGVSVVCFPVSPQVELQGKYADVNYPQERARQAADQLGVPFLDLLPVFCQHQAEALFADNCHLTSAGNRVVAEALVPWLSESIGKVAK